MKLYKKRKTYWNKIIYFIEIYNFKNSYKLHHLCYQDAVRGPNSYAPQPTSFPNHHTVVGETPYSTLASFYINPYYTSQFLY